MSKWKVDLGSWKLTFFGSIKFSSSPTFLRNFFKSNTCGKCAGWLICNFWNYFVFQAFYEFFKRLSNIINLCCVVQMYTCSLPFNFLICQQFQQNLHSIFKISNAVLPIYQLLGNSKRYAIFRHRTKNCLFLEYLSCPCRTTKDTDTKHSQVNYFKIRLLSLF